MPTFMVGDSHRAITNYVRELVRLHAAARDLYIRCPRCGPASGRRCEYCRLTERAAASLLEQIDRIGAAGDAGAVETLVDAHAT